MRAKLIYHAKEYYEDQSLLEVKIWETPKSEDRPHGLSIHLHTFWAAKGWSVTITQKGREITGTSKGKSLHMNL